MTQVTTNRAFCPDCDAMMYGDVSTDQPTHDLDATDFAYCPMCGCELEAR